MKVETKIFGVVGPIIGVSGVLLGAAKRKNMRGVAFLAETFGHPMYLGLRGAKALTDCLKTKLHLISLPQVSTHTTKAHSYST